jgi:hypothetical protein
MLTVPLSPLKVIFVPMNLTDINSQTAKKQLAQEDASSGSGSTSGAMAMGDIAQIQQMSSM